jgi:hypothetical protein
VVQFGHLFARGDTRTAAVRAMVVALKEVKIRGEIRTLVDYAIDMIQVGFTLTSSCVAVPDANVQPMHRPPLSMDVAFLAKDLVARMCGQLIRIAEECNAPSQVMVLTPSVGAIAVAGVHQQPHPHRLARLPHRCPGA